MTESDVTMSFLDHLVELRKRLKLSILAIGVGSTVGFATYPVVLLWFLAPFSDISEGMHTLTPIEAVWSRMKFSIYLGIVYTLPFLLYQALAFVVPALKQKEKKAVFATLFLGSALFAVGFIYAYSVVLPSCLSVLQEASFTGLPEYIKNHNRFSEIMSFGMQILLAFGVVFEIPLVLFSLMWFGLLKRASLIKFSRYFIVISFVIAAMLTPPDPLSQAMLAIPLILLYFLSILLASIFRIGN